MLKGSTGTKLTTHLLGRKVMAEYGPCKGCNSRTYYFKHEKLRIKDGKNYCRSCWLQIRRGVNVEYHPKEKLICKICNIGKLYGNRCYTCHPNTPDTENITEDRRIVAKHPKEHSNFNNKGTLINRLAYCQSIKCPNKIAHPRSEMIKTKRSNGVNVLFCSFECRDIFENQNTEFIFK